MIEKVALAEIENAAKSIPLVEKDSRLGWEPYMEYMADVGLPQLTVDGKTYTLYITHAGVSATDIRWVIADTGSSFPWGVTTDITFSIMYLDEGTNPILLEYYVWVDNYTANPLMSNKLELRSTHINRMGSGQWKTIDVPLQGINLDNMGLLGTDMKISGVNSQVVIKSISAQP